MRGDCVEDGAKTARGIDMLVGLRYCRCNRQVSGVLADDTTNYMVS
jgi:hypothetical protein